MNNTSPPSTTARRGVLAGASLAALLSFSACRDSMEHAPIPSAAVVPGDSGGAALAKPRRADPAETRVSDTPTDRNEPAESEQAKVKPAEPTLEERISELPEVDTVSYEFVPSPDPSTPAEATVILTSTNPKRDIFGQMLRVISHETVYVIQGMLMTELSRSLGDPGIPTRAERISELGVQGAGVLQLKGVVHGTPGLRFLIHVTQKDPGE